MALKTSLLITGDSAVAQKAVDDLARAVETLGAKGGASGRQLDQALTAASAGAGASASAVAQAAQDASRGLSAQTAAQAAASAGARAMTAAQNGASTALAAGGVAANDLEKRTRALLGVVDPAAAAQLRLADALSEARALHQAGALSAGNLAKVEEDLAAKARTLAERTAEQNQASAGAAEGFGALAGSILGAVSAESTIGTATAATVAAIAGLGSAGGGLAKFFGGPWGIAITAAGAVLGYLVEKSDDTSEALAQQREKLDAAAQAADAFGNAQSIVAKAIELSTGTMKTHNKELVESIRLQAELMTLQGKQAESDAKKSIAGLGDLGMTGTLGAFFSRAGGTGPLERVEMARQQGAGLRALRDDVLSGGLDATEIRKRVDELERIGGLAGYSAEQVLELKKALYALPIARNDQRAGQMAIDALDGKGVAAELKPYEREKKKRTPKIPDPTDTINGLMAQARGDLAEYGSAPTFLAKANEELAKLQEGLDKLDRIKPRSPLDVERIAAARALLIEAGEVIRANLDKPFTDFLRSQEQALAVTRLQAAGQLDQAAALGQVIALQDKMGPLDEAHITAIEASVEALSAARREQEKLTAARQEDLAALRSIEDAITGVLSGQLSLAGGAKGLFASFKQLAGQQAFRSLFGDTFDRLRDEIGGGTRGVTAELKAAIAAVRPPTDQLRANIVSAGAAAASFAETINAAAARATGGASAGYATGGLTPALDATLGRSASDFIATNPDLFASTDAPIVVSAKRIGDAGDAFLSATELFNRTGSRVLGGIGAALDRFLGTDLKDALGGIGAQLGTALKGAGIGGAVGSLFDLDKTGASIGGAIGNVLGSGGLGKSIGTSISKAVGGQLGSALGSAVPVIGSILGSVAGGLLGNLFASNKTGYAQIRDLGGGDVGVAGTYGTKGARQDEARSSAATLIDAVGGIADRLGGALGAFNLDVGTKNDKYVINTNNTSGGAAYPFPFDSAEEATAFAIADAFRDGAIKGISAAMQRALQAKAADPDKAVAEALKVKEVEAAIAKVGDQLAGAFDDVGKTAAERVRIAKAYGLDLIAVEKANAADRAKVVEQLTREQVGSLQDLVRSLTSGSQFEGSALDKVAALSTEIAKVKADFDAGVEGAGDTLADLYEQRLAASKDAYGTTAAYAADRAATLAEAQAVIARVNRRVTDAAAQASDPALATTNAALDENNDQNAQVIAALEAQNGLLAQLVAGSSSGAAAFDLAQVAV